jgi:hypothetical protein
VKIFDDVRVMSFIKGATNPRAKIWMLDILPDIIIQSPA